MLPTLLKSLVLKPLDVAAGVPNLGGITTIPTPAPWQPPTLQPWQAPTQTSNTWGR